MDRKERRGQTKPGGAKPGHEGHSRVLSAKPDAVVEHRADHCACRVVPLHGHFLTEVVSVIERRDLSAGAPVVIQYRRLAVRCPS